MVDAYPELRRLRDLRHAIGQLRLVKLAVGADGYNRTSLGPFRSRTGRCQPGASEYIICLSKWLRSLIQPRPGMAIAYVDWEQQEYGIAAALSGDVNMMAAYLSGDPYLAFAKQVGAVPSDATRASHANTREIYKRCTLGTQYLIGSHSLGRRIGKPEPYARELLAQHRRAFPTYWAWADRAANSAHFTGKIVTTFGWPLHVHGATKQRTLSNFPSQANGSEMLRIACILADEAGIALLGTVHDAIVAEGSADEIDEIVRRLRGIIAMASRLVLAGFELRTEATIVRHPARFIDPAGTEMWGLVWGTLGLAP
jgi:DNA polymerase I